MRKEGGRVFLFDPGFETVAGHHAATNAILASALEAVEIIAPRALDPAVSVNGIAPTRHFEKSLYQIGMRSYSRPDRLLKRLIYTMKREGPWHLAHSFERDIKDFFVRRDVGSDDIIVVHSESPPFTRALAAALRDLPQSRRPQIRVRFINAEWVQRDALQAYSSLAHSVPPSGLKLYVEFDGLIPYISGRFPGVPVGLLRVPIAPVTQLPARAERVAANGRLKVLFYGQPRRERGWFELPDLVSRLRGQPQITFTIHAGEMPARIGRSASAVIERLKALGAPVMIGRLGDDEVSGLLADHDLVVLPYDEEAYKLRGSSVALEALIHACPMIVTKGTVLEELVQNGNGRAAAASSEAVAPAIVAIASSYGTFAARAADEARRAEGWKDFESFY